MHFLHGKRCVTDTTASSVIQDGGQQGVHVCDKIYVKPLLTTQFGSRCHRLRDTTGENIVIYCAGTLNWYCIIPCTSLVYSIGLLLVLQ